MRANLSAHAPAKINLTLHVRGRRADGYHDIESLVMFARCADALALTPGRALGLATQGPTAQLAGPSEKNLVLKAAQALADRVPGLRAGHFILTKRLPVAAGLGGGSADAAAALRLLARVNALARDDARLGAAARATGADVPVCLHPCTRIMRGIGDILEAPLDAPAFPALLVNPGVAVATRDVFAALGLRAGERGAQGVPVTPPAAPTHAAWLAAIAAQANDLEAPAMRVAPVIADALTTLRALEGCQLARMSGSGATCFALFGSNDDAHAGAARLRARHADWWIAPTTLGGTPDVGDAIDPC
ncbi:MAG: 4-(cytidine 5'-diphospho)-2-C-methyl-D-erythritol kinase [Proteobacteria bacterium]|nr:4-(cytidine 5'-diphospho)-2-C-methyl-D-erythritol kinase [Pseudomonadota bacterium]